MDKSSSATDFRTLYGGKRSVLADALIHHDPYDQFAWVQEWRFAIADHLTFDKGEHVPDFRPSPFGPDRDSYAYEYLRDTDPDTESLWYALRILDRFRAWLGLAGQDY